MENTYLIKKLESIELDFNSDLKGINKYSIIENGVEIAEGSSTVNFYRIFSFEMDVKKSDDKNEVGFLLLESMFNDLNKVYTISQIEIEFKKNETTNSLSNMWASNDPILIDEKINHTYQGKWLKQLGFKFLEIESENEENTIISFYLDRSKIDLVGYFNNAFINTSQDIGNLYVVSEKFFDDSFKIMPSETNLKEGQLIVFNLFKDNVPINLRPFNSIEHGQLLDLKKLKEIETIDIYANLNDFDFIYENQIYSPKKIIYNLVTIESMINGLRNIKSDKVITKQDILECLKEYKIEVYEYGRNKAGDYSEGGIKLDTHIKKFGDDFYLDPYLKNLLPVIKYDFGTSRDLYPGEFKTEIIQRLIVGLGGDKKYNEIKSVVSKLTQCIRDYSLLIYSAQDHLEVLEKEALRVKKEIFNN